jgi:hypothetical protein
MNERTDYDANRGPLDRREYTRRKVDGFSSCAGCLFIVLWCLVALAFIACGVVRLLHG